MERIAFFPGSFDPFTIGHLDIVERALEVFDIVHIGVGENSGKNHMFPIHKRYEWVKNLFEGNKSVNVSPYACLTVEACKQLGIMHIVRGIRYVSDFESEKMIADINRQMSGVDTVFFTCKPEHSWVSSTLVREVLRNNGDITPYVPEAVLKGISL